MPSHSIIVPHRNRLQRLALCVWSIERSARICGIDDYEIIVADQGSIGILPVGVTGKVRIVSDLRPMSMVDTPKGPVALFNKPRAINRGIKAAQGDVLTFLDADAVVGGRWLTGAEWLASDEGADTTRLCYRVRILPEETADELGPGPQADQKVGEWFRRYDEGKLFTRGHEGYAAPEINATGCWDPRLTFGNSQFSIRGDVLGDLRCDETYIGAGYEDLEFIQSIWRQAGVDYSGVIRTKADEAMFHIYSVRESDWHNADANQVNRERYRQSLSLSKSGYC